MKLSVFIIAIFCAVPAWAKPISVDSGEHKDFTRLVLYLQNKENWNLSETQDLATLKVENWTKGFDLSEIYKRIGTDRLKSVSASEGNLVMSLGCECTVVAKALDGGFVSLDIQETSARQPPPQPDSSVVADSKETPPVLTQIQDELKTEWPIIFEQQPEYLALERAIKQLNRSPANIFESGLGKELARSASLSYLEPSGVKLSGASGEPNGLGTKDKEALLAELGRRAKFSNAGSFDSEIFEDVKNTCPSPEEFAVSKWGGDLPFPDQLAALRANLYSEFDEIDRKAARQLVRFFVHYGLDVEVGRAVENFGDYEELSRLVDLAEIVSFRSGDRHESSELSNCDQEANFWNLIASADLGETSRERVQELITVFQKLPFHLKELTTDRLVGLLTNAEFLTAADIVQNAVKLDQETGVLLEEPKKLDSTLGSLSQEQLLTLIEGSDLQSPLALAFYVENAFRSETAVSTEIIELTASYIHQQDGTDIAKRLLSAQVLALAGRQENADAMDLLFANNIDDFDDPDGLNVKLINKMLSGAKPSDVSRLAWVLAKRGSLTSIPKGELLALAQFLENNGLPELALMSLIEVEETMAVANVRARAIAQSGRRDDAARLATESSLDVIDTRLSEILLSEDPSAAWGLRDRLSGEAADRAAWLSGNWSAVPKDDDKAEISELLTKAVDTNDLSETPIQDGQVAFSDSQNARRVLQNLLN